MLLVACKTFVNYISVRNICIHALTKTRSEIEPVDLTREIDSVDYLS